MAELDPRSSVMRRLCRVAHLAAVLPSHHSPLSETESRSPVRGQLVAYSCLSVHVHSLPPSVYPPHPPIREKILHCREDRARKWSLLLVRDTLVVGIRTVLIRQIPAGRICSAMTPVVVASCASWSSPQCYLRFEAVTSSSLCLTM